MPTPPSCQKAGTPAYDQPSPPASPRRNDDWPARSLATTKAYVFGGLAQAERRFDRLPGTRPGSREWSRFGGVGSASCLRNRSAGLGEIISRDTTQTVIKAATPTPAQYAQVVTITVKVRNVGGLIAPVGSVTFTDSYTQGGLTTNTILGTVILPSVSAGVSQVQATAAACPTATNGPLERRSRRAPGRRPAGGQTAGSAITFAAHSLQAIYNGDTAAPFPLPSTFPYRGQWLPSTSGVYGLPVRGDAERP
jgi:hypothetical protein